MLKDFLTANSITSGANYVDYGYAQVEPNHLSAQRTGQIYAQLPAASTITKLEQGQFVKYDYAANTNGIGEVNFTGEGEWMLVFNEIKLYREGQADCEFAMLKDNYQARIYSPYDWENTEATIQSRYYNGVDNNGNTSVTVTQASGTTKTYTYDDVTAPADPYEINYNVDPFKVIGRSHAKKMTAGTTMVPRVFKTNVGDIFTTNALKLATATTAVAVGDKFSPGSDGFLAPVQTGTTYDMIWKVTKKYTMPDGQKAVKLIRIK